MLTDGTFRIILKETHILQSYKHTHRSYWVKLTAIKGANRSGHWNLTDIDECLDAKVPCANGGRCVDGINSYTCDCADGYVGKYCGEKIVALLYIKLGTRVKFSKPKTDKNILCLTHKNGIVNCSRHQTLKISHHGDLKIYRNYFGQTWKRRPDIFETTRFNIIYKQDIVWISLEKRVKMTLGTFKMCCKSLPWPRAGSTEEPNFIAP